MCSPTLAPRPPVLEDSGVGALVSGCLGAWYFGIWDWVTVLGAVLDTVGR